MRHCVFCAGKDIPKNKKAIELANKTYQRLEEEWMLVYCNHTIVSLKSLKMKETL